MDASARVSAPEDIRGDRAAGAVETLRALVAKDLLAVNSEIVKRMGSGVELIPELGGHLVKSGGKRLRPMLTLAAARMFGYEGDAHVRLGAAVEFIHTATLLHDDVVDDSSLRRGESTANVIWGNQASVLVGDFLFSRAFELMVDVGDPDVLKILSRASSVIVEGEIMQLGTQRNLGTTLDDCLDVIDAKTAALFSAAAQVGGLCGQASQTQNRALSVYGRKLGVAFQLTDDALDYSGRQVELGKTVGDDFREGKLTMPVALAVQRATDGDRTFWERTIGDGDIRDGDLERALELMDRLGVIEETLRISQDYADESKSALGELPANAFSAALSDIADFAVARAY